MNGSSGNERIFVYVTEKIKKGVEGCTLFSNLL